jgi:hypothetical protein
MMNGPSIVVEVKIIEASEDMHITRPVNVTSEIEYCPISSMLTN